MREKEKTETLEQFVTNCCGTTYYREGRAKYNCKQCHKDVSLDLIFLWQAVDGTWEKLDEELNSYKELMNREIYSNKLVDKIYKDADHFEVTPQKEMHGASIIYYAIVKGHDIYAQDKREGVKTFAPFWGRFRVHGVVYEVSRIDSHNSHIYYKIA